MSTNSIFLILAIIFFIFAFFGLPAVGLAWQWLGFAAWAASGVAWRTQSG